MWALLKRRRNAADDNLGARGERIARKAIKRRGLKILTQNYRCPVGELDFIALDRPAKRAGGAETIVFIEVKTRSSDRHTAPQSAVNADKRRRIKKTANYYLNTRKTGGYNLRFDIVAIVIGPDDEPKIDYIQAAFC